MRKQSREAIEAELTAVKRVQRRTEDDHDRL